MTSSERTRTGLLMALALACVAVVAIVVTQREAVPTPATIVEAELGSDNLVRVRIDRCGSDMSLGSVVLDGERLVVEVTATAGSGDECTDEIDVATITADVVAIEDATSGEVFQLRTARPEQANRPPGTRQ